MNYITYTCMVTTCISNISLWHVRVCVCVCVCVVCVCVVYLISIAHVVNFSRAMIHQSRCGTGLQSPILKMKRRQRSVAVLMILCHQLR